MSPPAPLPEHEFEQFLRENDCRGKRRTKEYAIYRKSDGKLVSTYAVSHGKGKREVKPVYKENFLKALVRIRQEEELAEAEKKNKVKGQAPKEDDWRDSDWYKQQKLNKDWQEPHKSEEGTP